jgi:hypothetical protein
LRYGDCKSHPNDPRSRVVAQAIVSMLVAATDDVSVFDPRTETSRNVPFPGGTEPGHPEWVAMRAHVCANRLAGPMGSEAE